MYHLRRATVVVIFLGVFILAASLLPRILAPVPPTAEEKQRDKQWVSSSPYWIDRQACRWLGLCGVMHVRWDAPVLKLSGDNGKDKNPQELRKRSEEPYSWEVAQGPSAQEKQGPQGWNDGEKVTVAESLRDIPDYVLRYAPMVHLYSGENFWPSDIAEHIQHMMPFLNGSLLNTTEPMTLANMHRLNAEDGRVFLTSKEDVEERPEWLHSHVGVPEAYEWEETEAERRRREMDQEELRLRGGTSWWDVNKDRPLHRISDPRRIPYQDTSAPPYSRSRPFSSRAVRSKNLRRRQLAGEEPEPQRPFPGPPGSPDSDVNKPDPSGYSSAPAVLIMVDKGSGIMDAFWFFFYSYNLGQTVLEIRFGNHVADWEHCMIRFENGVPRAMFLSEHEGGQAYAWEALEKRAMNATINGHNVTVDRPVIYSAVGSHAMYAFPGAHPYVLPFKMLKDVTDDGPLWDPSLNNYAYFYDYKATPPGEDEQMVEQSFDESRPYPFSTANIDPHAKPRDSTSSDDNDGELATESQDEPTTLTPASSNPRAPTSWFHFTGPWGDELYGLFDIRQWRIFGQYHYVTGPMGPKFKHLGREKVCQTDRCRILHSIEEGKRKAWY